MGVVSQFATLGLCSEISFPLLERQNVGALIEKCFHKQRELQKPCFLKPLFYWEQNGLYMFSKRCLTKFAFQ
jgi:hypothetical protein